MCQFELRSTETGSKSFLSVSVGMFLEEISIWVSRQNKQDLQQMWAGTVKPIEYPDTTKKTDEIFIGSLFWSCPLDIGTPGSWLSLQTLRLNTSSPSGTQMFSLWLRFPHGLSSHADGLTCTTGIPGSWVFLVFIITWTYSTVNLLLYITIYRIGSASLKNPD
jgi:hypothetical protein